MGVNHSKDQPWLIRTYGGYASAAASNALYRAGLANGQTGLSIAFDLPTQTGYDADHPMAKGEVGKVGVPVSHIDDMRQLLEGIPLDRMNSSMTINATAAWLLALYIAVADERGTPRETLRGTIQNDILKEYLSRGTYAFPPEPSIRLTVDTIEFTGSDVPKWNWTNVCSYHLQEAGAGPVLEVAFTLANAICYLDAARERGVLTPERVGSISFFCNAGVRFIEETCKMRAFTRLWDRICLERYGVADARQRRFRYGVQVNSLGLTAVQPENNVYRILLEMLGVTLSKDARARSVQLPAWNEALGLPRPWDQQWSRRAQQILAHETDLLEYEDIFEGSRVIEDKTSEIAEGSWDELQRVLDRGGSLNAIEYMKEQLVIAHSQRIRAIESGDLKVMGVNLDEQGEPSPLTANDGSFHIVKVSAAEEAAQIERLHRFREARDKAAVTKAIDALRRAAAGNGNILPPSVDAARAGVTTGEWAAALREIFGEYRAPTGVTSAAASPNGSGMAEARGAVDAAAARLGAGRVRMLVGKPGLDGHSNGAEQLAVRARDLGMEVVYPGIRLTPAEIAQAAAQEDVHVVALSILSGGHDLLVPDVLNELARRGLGDLPVVVGGIIPDDDADRLLQLGVARVFTPKDKSLTQCLSEVAGLLGRSPARR